MFDHASLQALLCPRSIAVVGASANAQKIGGIPIHLLKQFGYAGKIYPVNPKGGDIQGLPAFENIGQIDGPVDLAILAVPQAVAEQALREAGAAGVKAVVLFTSGYAEVGEAGQAAQAALSALARELGIRIVGPNCLGLMNVRQNVFATFTPAPLAGTVLPGSIGLVSQSGAFGIYAYAMARERNIGLSYWVSTGNECDVELADVVAWMARDPDTRVIMGYMEGCRDGEKLKAALALARDAGKPVVITKVGRTGAGAAAAASHTAALAGDDAIFDAMLRQYGAIRTRTVEEFFNLGYVLGQAVRPSNPHVGIMTLSGGVGALMADDAEDAGLSLPAMPEAAQRAILARVPFAAPRNPVDITGQVTSEPDLLEFAAHTMLREGGYGSLLAFMAAAGTSPTLWPHVLNFAKAIRRDYPDTPLAICAMFSPERSAELEALGCIVFRDPSAAIHAMAALGRCSAQHPAAALPPSAQSALAALSVPAGTLNEFDGLALLREIGVPVVNARMALSVEDAEAAASALGYPVVLKVVSAEITHKSDVGGVCLGLADAQSMRAAYHTMLAEVAAKAPCARLQGVLVSPMVRGGTECILGAHRDPVFGPVVMFGLGGIFVEAMRDVSFRLAPFGRHEALSMIDEIRGKAVLNGLRGRAPADIDKLADALVALSGFAHRAGDSLSSVDINPFLVLSAGEGALALDAVVIGNAAA